MPIKIPDGLPAQAVLESENIFVMGEGRATTQQIRPLRILILNLMPKKIETETQLLRMLSNTPLQVEVELLKTATHVSKNTSEEHLLKFYKIFADIKEDYFDGMVITGAPVELLEFEQVSYWAELCEIMEWSKTHVHSTLHICWGAQAGLHYHYGLNKHPLPKKMFGVFPHTYTEQTVPLLRGFDEVFYMPHSRHTEIWESDIREISQLKVLSTSPMAGVNICSNLDGRQIFCFGHSEYESDTLAKEYFRDLGVKDDVELPYNYFPNNDPQEKPLRTWRSHAYLFYSNWLNYYVYQSTPYDLMELKALQQRENRDESNVKD